MRSFHYWLCFALVAVPTIVRHLLWAITPLQRMLPSPIEMLLGSLRPFSFLVPQAFSALVPYAIHVGLGLFLLLLAVRRTWYVIAKHDRIPATFGKTQTALAKVAFISLLLVFAVPAITANALGGSGIYTGPLFPFSVFCFQWAFVLTEIKSLMSAGTHDG